MEQPAENTNKTAQLGIFARVIFFAAAAVLALFSADSASGMPGAAASIIGAALILVSALSANNPVDTAASFLPGIAACFIYALIWADRSDGIGAAFLSAAPSLFMTILAFGLWFTVRLGKSRASSIAFTASICVILWMLCAAARIRYYTGKLDITTVRAVLDAFFDPVRSMLASIKFDHGDTSMQVYSDADIANMINATKRTFIGTLGALMLIAAYLVTAAARIISATFGVFSVFPTEERDEIAIMPTGENDDNVGIFVERVRLPWRIEVSTVSAVVAVAAYFVCMLFSDPDRQLAAVTVAENLMILLMPGLVYVGIRSLACGLTGNSRGLFGLRSGRKNPLGSIIIFFMAIVLFFVSPAAPLMLMSLNGVIDIFSENFRRSGASRIGGNDIDDRKE